MVHLITDNEVRGFGSRIDNFFSDSLFYYGVLNFCEKNANKKYCYAFEYEPHQNFICASNQGIIHSNYVWSQKIGKLQDFTILIMDKIFKYILSHSDYFSVFFSYLHVDCNVGDCKNFFTSEIDKRAIYVCDVLRAKNIFTRLLDFSEPNDGRMFYAPSGQDDLDYRIIYPCDTLEEFDNLPSENGLINIHNILFQVKS